MCGETLKRGQVSSFKTNVPENMWVFRRLRPFSADLAAFIYLVVPPQNFAI